MPMSISYAAPTNAPRYRSKFSADDQGKIRQGHTYLIVEDEPLTTVDILSEALKSAFLPNRSTNYYKGELHNLYKKPGEHVLDYVSRTKDLRHTILDAEARVLDHRFTPVDCVRINQDVLECFTNGLSPEFLPLRLENCQNITEAF